MATPRMAPARLNEANVREILPWKNNCASSCMADYLVDRLLNSNEITDDTIQRLGEMIKTHYGLERAPNREELKKLFSAPHLTVPFDWQVVLGVVFHDILQAECRAPEYKGVIDSLGMMTPEAFAILADKLKVNVEFYLRDLEGAIKSATGSELSVFVAPGLPELKSIKKSESESALRVLHHREHYYRLVEDAAIAARLNQLDHDSSFNERSAIASVRDKPAELKKAVKARLTTVMNVVSSERRSSDVKHELRAPRDSHEAKFQEFMKPYKSFLKTLKEEPVAAELSDKLQKALDAEGEKNQEYDLTLVNGEAKTVKVTQADREALDALLAKKLQLEEESKVDSAVAASSLKRSR